MEKPSYINVLTQQVRGFYHNADCICPAAEKKKAAAGQSFLMPKYEYHGGFDFQSRQFFYFWRLIGGSRLDCRPLP